MKRMGIVAALWIEAKLLCSKMTNKKIEKYASMKFYIGQIGTIDVFLVVCGIGKVNASISTQILISKYAVDAIINTGIAGSMDDAVAQGTIIIADCLTYHDIQLEQMTKYFPFQDYFYTDTFLTNMLIEIAPNEGKKGLIITGDMFIDSDQKKKKLKETFPKALCVDMEGCAIANTAFINHIPFAVIRCISDFANDNAIDEYHTFEEAAASVSAEIIYKYILLWC